MCFESVSALKTEVVLHARLRSVTFQKTVHFMLIALKISDFIYGYIITV